MGQLIIKVNSDFEVIRKKLNLEKKHSKQKKDGVNRENNRHNKLCKQKAN